MHNNLFKKANLSFYEEMCKNFLVSYKTLPLTNMRFKITNNDILPTLSLKTSEYFILNLNEKDINELAISKKIDIYEALYEKIIYELYHIIYLAKADFRKKNKNRDNIGDNGENVLETYEKYNENNRVTNNDEIEKLKNEIKKQDVETLKEYKDKYDKNAKEDITKKDANFDIKSEYRKYEVKVRNKNIIDYFKKHLDKKLDDVTFRYGCKTTLSYRRLNNRREESKFLLPGIDFIDTVSDSFFRSKGVIILVDYSGSTNDYNDLLNDFCFDMSKRTNVFIYNDTITEYNGSFKSLGNTSIIKAIDSYIDAHGDALFKNNYIYIFTDGIDKYDELIRKYDLDIFRYDMRNHLVEYKRYYNKGRESIEERETF